MQTVGDLDKAFRLYVDKADSQGSADFLVGERQRFFNDAQLRLCRELCFAKTDDQDAVDLRRTLSTFASLPLQDDDQGSQAILPDNYLAWGRAQAQLSAPYSNYSVSVKVISEDELNAVLEDPFNRPAIGEPLACFLHGKLRYYPVSSAQRLLLTYYRLPADLDLSTPTQVPDLAPATLPTLVQYAVQLALESVQDPRFQSQAVITTATANA